MNILGQQIGNRWLLGIALIIVAVVMIFGLSKNDYDLPKNVDFNFHVRPILSENCFVCHGPDSSSREAKLRLDVRESAIAQRENGVAIMPDFPNKSQLIKRIISDDPEFHMPPPEANKRLTAYEIAILKKWIQQGAEWKTYWAFNKPEMPVIPISIANQTPAQIINHFIEEGIHAKGLKTSKPASKNELVRRVAYLLTGLPPSPDEVSRFLNDPWDGAYEKIVDHYLNSPHFGERWARHWMDLMRYGEHMGHEFDFTISGAWQYRDYLIRAFNQDVPYNLFVQEHLAGDQLNPPRLHPTEGFNESILGTAYFFLGEGKHSPVSLKGEELDRIDNMIDVTSKTFQALTVSCARCHDHKFDPIPTTDYYAMYGMMESSRIGTLPAKISLKTKQQLKELKEIKDAIALSISASTPKVIQVKNKDLSEIHKQKQYIQSLQSEANHFPDTDNLSMPDSSDYRVIGDFRDGLSSDWYQSGEAFGVAPVYNEFVFDQSTESFEFLTNGQASSRYYSAGFQGTLHSPNFIIEHDSIAIKARGLGSTIRIIVDNFQVIQYPLWGSFEQQINSEEWKTYKLDLSRAKGHKAYVAIFPGQYEKHKYHIKAHDYIEAQWAATFDKRISASFRSGSKKWNSNRFGRPTSSLKHKISAYTEAYHKLADQLYDSTHFIGVVEGDPVYSKVFIRGDKDQLSEEKISHRFLHAVNMESDSFPQHGSGRMAWAKAVVDPDNPLTSRVMVNRIWHHLFGRGIVETVDNFGVQGKLPSHPELLDYLALHFMDQKWSVKKLIKDIVMSQTFQRSTRQVVKSNAKDPENIYLHHYPIRRLEAEAIRDGILAASGSLDTTMYGEPIPIYLTEFMTGRGRPGQSGPLDGGGRRSVYTTVRRNFLSPMMLVFDTPMPFSTFGKRNTTNVPAQSLTLMNDPFIHEQAEKWAARLLENTNTSKERIAEIYSVAFSRVATEEEILGAEQLLRDLASELEGTFEELKNDHGIWAAYCHTIFNHKEFIYLI